MAAKNQSVESSLKTYATAGGLKGAKSRRRIACAEPREGSGGSHISHPAMSDAPYSDAESEYLKAVADWQKRSGVRFPTACDYRQVLLSLGYNPPRANPTIYIDAAQVAADDEDKRRRKRESQRKSVAKLRAEAKARGEKRKRS